MSDEEPISSSEPDHKLISDPEPNHLMDSFNKGCGWGCGLLIGLVIAGIGVSVVYNGVCSYSGFDCEEYIFDSYPW